MKIRRFNENIENDDFISIEEVKEIFAHLYDFQDLDIEIEYKWLSGDSEYHVLDDKEEDDDVKSIVVEADLTIDDSNNFYGEYGYDIVGSPPNGLRVVSEVIKEIVDGSKHLESQGYETTTQINNYNFIITIAKKGTLIL